MTDPRIETIERVWAAYNRADVDAVLAEMTEDVVADWSNSIGPHAGLHQGRKAARAFFRSFLEVWEELRWEHGEPEVLSDGRVLIATWISARGRGSGIEIDARGAQLVSFEGARVSALRLFQSLDDARLHLRRERLAAARLYFVCDARPGGGDPEPLLEAALRGGVDLIQLREKALRCAEDLVAFAEPFRRAAGAHGALFFLNDHPELVEACGADGVHVGQDDTPVAEARAQAGPGALVGLSTHSAEQFDAALAAEGAGRPDQLSAGPVWETPTKQGRPAAGLELIEHAAATAGDAAWFAIGGIDASNIGQVVAAGARRVVVVRAIRDTDDPEAAARRLRKVLEGAAVAA